MLRALSRLSRRVGRGAVRGEAILSVAPCPAHLTEQRRTVAALPALKIYSLRRRFAEKFANKYDETRVSEVGPDLACLEWAMEGGATRVTMSDGTVISSIADMKKYMQNVHQTAENCDQEKLLPGDLAYEQQWPAAPRVHIVSLDASDSAVSDEGFRYIAQLRRLETLKLNFCDYFGDDAMRYLATGRTATSLRDLEIVLNPSLTDGAAYWLCRLKALKRAHFYFLPYVSNRTSFVRQLKLALPRCQVTFPEVENVGYGYEQKN